MLLLQFVPIQTIEPRMEMLLTEFFRPSQHPGWRKHVFQKRQRENVKRRKKEKERINRPNNGTEKSLIEKFGKSFSSSLPRRHILSILENREYFLFVLKTLTILLVRLFRPDAFDAFDVFDVTDVVDNLGYFNRSVSCFRFSYSSFVIENRFGCFERNRFLLKKLLLCDRL